MFGGFRLTKQGHGKKRLAVLVTGVALAMCLPFQAFSQGGFNGPGRYEITNVKSGKVIDLDELRSSGVTLLDPDRAIAAAQDFLARTGHTGRVRVEGAEITVTVDVVQTMRILPLPDRTVTAGHTATALTGETADG